MLDLEHLFIFKYMKLLYINISSLMLNKYFKMPNSSLISFSHSPYHDRIKGGVVALSGGYVSFPISRKVFVSYFARSTFV